MIDIHRAGRRYPGGDEAGGITSRYAFSFGRHYDPDNLAFGPLTACNEELLAPGAGFTEHTHREVEIVTWVVEGELAHRDDAGHHSVVRAGQAQWLSAGAGVRHSEREASGVRPCRFVQMWLVPELSGGVPEYGITSDAVVRLPRLPGARLRAHRGDARLPDAPFVHVSLIRGRLRLGGLTLDPGDSARITAEPALTARGGPDTEYLVWAMPAPVR